MYRDRHLSQAEIKMIFRVADLNHDNQVSFQEWIDFHGLFVEPFQLADSRKFYLLSEDNLWDEAFKSGFLEHIRYLVKANQVENLIGSLDRFDLRMNLNFADYIFLRRANLAWGQCS